MGLLDRWKPPGGMGVHQSRTTPGHAITNREVAENELKHLVRASNSANTHLDRMRKAHKAAVKTGNGRKINAAAVELADAGIAARQAKNAVTKAARALKKIQN